MRFTGSRLLLCMVLAACVPPPAPPLPQPMDGAGRVSLGNDQVTSWAAREPPLAVVVAVHGLKGSPAVFSGPAERWARLGFLTYAWAVTYPQVDVADFVRMLQQVATRHPGVPLYVVGESMGASLAVIAAATAEAPPVDGLVLSAPAIMPDSVTADVAIGALALAGLATGSRAPAYWGEIFALMERARERAPAIAGVPVLVLLGDADTVVPQSGVAALLANLRDPPLFRLITDGSHSLFRDQDGAALADQVGDWMLAQRHGVRSSHPELVSGLPGVK